ncbi:NADPH-adrenodoxin reductase [Nadsonia fulvescens var. elongata DSM 6958]|uniref:NADPH:adrenodoxin oxidoreductase, mitochondrial n=1 Tax=Nadsonia fulvescens var. elongata DSM 6958 TaxID=857566 RepID=A0A1E3PRT2_9ASCO|nr:NADPH-adrenodoxin reductase [Nadsonia fulvescens var. elongata DSM 6958]
MTAELGRRIVQPILSSTRCFKRVYSDGIKGSNLKIAVVGSGPAGFYTAYRAMTLLPGCKVDLYESFPIPFGLARFGVAPDHPEVKNCQEKFEEVARSPNFRFVGNVKVGEDVSLNALTENYNSLVFAYGASIDRELGIPGENLDGVYSAKDFVGWYNGFPQCFNLNPLLSDSENAVIIGQGNVALDVARILLTPVDDLRKTDISEHALEQLSRSRVKNVKIVGRRGLLQSAFTNKEVRELFSLKNCSFVPLEDKYIRDYRKDLSSLKRQSKRLVDLIDKYTKPDSMPLPKKWSLEYLKSPLEFLPSNKNSSRVGSTIFEENILTEDKITGSFRALGSGSTVTMDSDIALRSIGYKSTPLTGFSDIGVQFNDKRGILVNEAGRVCGGSELKPIPGFYTAGWLKNGPTGVIAFTMGDSFDTAENLVQDYNLGILDLSPKLGFDGIKNAIKSRVVSWEDWEKIDKFEKANGAKLGKPREKFISTEQMLNVLG